jgi:hypothetical protein
MQANLSCSQLIFNPVMNAFWKVYYQKQRFSTLNDFYVLFFLNQHYITYCVFLLVLTAKKLGANQGAQS